MTDNTLLYIWWIFEGLFICYLIYLLKGVKMHEKVHSNLFYIGRALITSVSIAIFCIIVNNALGC